MVVTYLKCLMTIEAETASIVFKACEAMAGDLEGGNLFNEAMYHWRRMWYKATVADLYKDIEDDS